MSISLYTVPGAQVLSCYGGLLFLSCSSFIHVSIACFYGAIPLLEN